MRSMFGKVAHRYDLANHLLSANIDRSWRSHTVDRVRDILQRPNARVMDLACGTGDLLAALECAAGRQLMGSDFCHPMLTGAQGKLARANLKSTLLEADALSLPLPDASLDLITIAFGFRNLANYRAGLTEMRRVLRPGGALAILEFTQPPNKAFAALCQLVLKTSVAHSGRKRFPAPPKRTSIYRNQYENFPRLRSWLR